MLCLYNTSVGHIRRSKKLCYRVTAVTRLASLVLVVCIFPHVSDVGHSRTEAKIRILQLSCKHSQLERKPFPPPPPPLR